MSGVHPRWAGSAGEGVVGCWDQARLIPAGAGSARDAGDSRGRRAVHPRGAGSALQDRALDVPWEAHPRRAGCGSSLRIYASSRPAVYPRRAGFTSSAPCCRVRVRVHPRFGVCLSGWRREWPLNAVHPRWRGVCMISRVEAGRSQGSSPRRGVYGLGLRPVLKEDGSSPPRGACQLCISHSRAGGGSSPLRGVCAVWYVGAQKVLGFIPAARGLWRKLAAHSFQAEIHPRYAGPAHANPSPATDKSRFIPATRGGVHRSCVRGVAVSVHPRRAGSACWSAGGRIAPGGHPRRAGSAGQAPGGLAVAQRFIPAVRGLRRSPLLIPICHEVHPRAGGVCVQNYERGGTA